MAARLLESPLHRIPTLWSLYRPLFKSARRAPLASDERQVLYAHVRDEFKRSTKLGNVDKIKRKWLKAERLLEQLEGAHSSTVHLDRTRELARYLVDRSSLPAHPPPPPSSNEKPRRPRSFRRPSILHSTQFAPPMLRKRPQPIGTTMMIFNRRRKSQRRYDQLEVAKAYVQLTRDEEAFEARLGLNHGDKSAKWGGEWREWIGQAREKERREQHRNNLRIPDELQAQANKLNKSREQHRQYKPRSRVRPRSDRAGAEASGDTS